MKVTYYCLLYTSAEAASDAIQTAVLADERSEKWMEGKSIVKVSVVPKKIVNIVVK